MMTAVRRWTGMVTAAMMSGFLLGCSNAPKLARDPFLPGGRQPAPVTTSTQARDNQREISNSPATDPFFGARQQNRPRGRQQSVAADGSANETMTPAFSNDAVAFARDDSSSEPSGPAPQAVNATSKDEQKPAEATDVDFQKIRQRLENAGVNRNWRVELNPTTKEYEFYCEVPIPDKPGIARAFTASDESEFRAMLAVTEAVEKWIANGRP